MSTKIAVVYHSGYGHTKVQAENVLKGVAGTPGVSATLITSDDALKDMTTLNEADCIIFGCPTYMGGPSAQFKSFIDATSKVWFKLGWKDKLAAGFTNSGNPSGDKLSTLSQLMILAMQHGMVWVGTGFLRGTDNSQGTEHELNRLSSYVGIMAESPQGAPEPIAADLATARTFGARVAKATLRWTQGKEEGV